MSEEIENMIDMIAQSNYEKATDIFQSALASRVNDALEQEKVSIASSMWDENEDQLEMDLDEEEYEEALDEVESDPEEDEEDESPAL